MSRVQRLYKQRGGDSTCRRNRRMWSEMAYVQLEREVWQQDVGSGSGCCEKSRWQSEASDSKSIWFHDQENDKRGVSSAYWICSERMQLEQLQKSTRALVTRSCWRSTTQWWALGKHFSSLPIRTWRTDMKRQERKYGCFFLAEACRLFRKNPDTTGRMKYERTIYSTGVESLLHFVEMDK